MDLLTFLRLGKRLLRLVTVLVFALRPRLANVYYNNDLNIMFEKKKWLVGFSKTTANYGQCNQTYQANDT